MDNPERILQRLDWTVVRRLDGILQGDYRTLFRGAGLDLADLREYQLTDDVRHIDWNVTARMDRPYVRTFTEDRDITAWFLLDLSPSVDFGTVRALKRDVVTDFVAVLARLLTRHGNRVGAVLYDDRIEGVIPPACGRRQVLRLLDAIGNQPKLRHAPETDLGALLGTALRILRRRSLVFLVSDFVSIPGWDRPLGLLGQRHEVLAIRVSDPRERELPDVGPVVLEDSETGRQLYVDTRDRGFRRRFAEAARRREQEFRASCGRAGVDLAELSTEGDLVKELIKLAAIRKQRRKAPATFAAPRDRGLAPEASARGPLHVGLG